MTLPELIKITATFGSFVSWKYSIIEILILKCFASFKDSGLWLPGILLFHKLALVFRRQTFALHYSSNSWHRTSFCARVRTIIPATEPSRWESLSSQSTLNYMYILRFNIIFTVSIHVYVQGNGEKTNFKKKDPLAKINRQD